MLIEMGLINISFCCNENKFFGESNEKINIFSEIPECIKLALVSTLEIITILNNEINKIHNKIQIHHKRWISYIYSIKIQQEMDTILEHNIIFDKRFSFF